MKTLRLLSGLALLILGAWLCAFNDVRPVKAGVGSRDSNYNNCSFTGCGGGGGGITLTHTDAQINDAGYTVSGSFTINVGTASADRIVMVGFADSASVAQDSGYPTLNGTPMNLIAGNGVGGTTANHGFWYLSVPSGTTATFDWSHTSEGSQVQIVNVVTLHGQSAGASATPTSAVFDTNQAAADRAIVGHGAVWRPSRTAHRWRKRACNGRRDNSDMDECDRI
jgi:hypothetical protein